MKYFSHFSYIDQLNSFIPLKLNPRNFNFPLCTVDNTKSLMQKNAPLATLSQNLINITKALSLSLFAYFRY